MTKFKRLPGLPPYGEQAIGFPPKWASSGHEGVVVEFTTEDGSTWIGNFAQGIGGLDSILHHPNGSEILVLARGDLWVVDPENRTASEIGVAVFSVHEVSEPKGFVFSRQNLAFFRLGVSGIIWHTRRISWDGFRKVRIEGNQILGEAFFPTAEEDEWVAFEVDLKTGRSSGGSYSGPAEEWESIAK